MTWSARTSAVQVVSGQSIVPLPATSVAVVRTDMTGTELTMYGVNASHLAGISPYNSTAIQAVDASGFYPVGYIIGRSGPYAQDFRLRSRVNLINNTGIAGQRNCVSTGESVICLNYSSTGVGTAYSATFQQSELVTVRYKDPCVVFLPSLGRWMMILCRVRTFLNNGGMYNANPFTSISDVVAFTDPLDTFNSTNGTGTADQWGPYWLASSLGAMPNTSYRLSLGVPCGFEYTDSAGNAFLYLYYSLDPCDLTRTNPTPQLMSAVDTTAQIGVTYPGSSFSSRLGIKIISTTQFTTAPTVAEVDWESVLATYTNNIVPGVLQRSVRLWMARYGTMYDVVRFETATQNTRPVDPAIAVDATNSNQPAPNTHAASYTAGENISLYFAANMADTMQASVPYFAYGIWRATAVPEGVTWSLNVINSAGISTNTVMPTFGVDFVVRHVEVSNYRYSVLGMDHVAPSTTTTDANVDPEPVLLYSGAWRVFMGHGDVYNPGGQVLLQYVESSIYSDFLCPITAAWT